MRKIVNKNVYDTEKALMIAGNWKNSLEKDNAIATSEDLYINPQGQFFLHCCSTKTINQYNYANDMKLCRNETIIPLTNAKTFKWLEKNNEVEVIEKYFSDYIEEA